MSAVRAVQVPAERLSERAEAVLERVRCGEAVELAFEGRAVALVIPLGARPADVIGAPSLRGRARYASEDDLFSTGESWDADQ